MKWRIRESSHGGYVAERGISHEGDALAPSGIGYTMPAFIVYESRRFDTMAQARRYIEKNN